ncbi:hypothetical protein ASF49_10745 [Methylobacterium sp. Leaf104]|uniref:DUF5666 domain-containing protein n=1 Tax=Methylobacterium TaxID=407 RepID=UPI0006F6C215|nr:MULTISPECIES: DUF5666 domain-containing protein [Methylobacterium]KQP31054.1 hypothetical protein ASF49_10745 [Methylobacterium sp. Leaf104]MCI9881133.1 hypothetical protein [Methylobacterium goesingense]
MRAPNRRDALRLLASAPFALAARADPLPPIRDQGIGGTGARPSQPPGDGQDGEGDRGLGGTGVIGTIRKFGSIIVNDLRIAYPKDVLVRIDGRPASAGDLRIGHVVRVVALEAGSALSTRRIDVTSEVVGPVEAVRPGGLTVLGQRVALPTAQRDGWTLGERVAVSGLRRPDGVVVASLVERRPEGPARVAGLVRRGPDGTPMIGALRLLGADAGPAGRRVIVSGDPTGTGLTVTGQEEAHALFAPGLRRVSIEAYVGRNARGLQLGSGLDVAGRPDPGLPRRGSVRAVVTAEPSRDGRLNVESLRIDGRGSERPGLRNGTDRGSLPRLDGRGFEGRGSESRGLDGRVPGGQPGGAPRFDIDTRAPAGAERGRPGGGFGGGPGGFERPGGFGRGPDGPGGFGGGPGRGPGGGGGPGGR